MILQTWDTGIIERAARDIANGPIWWTWGDSNPRPPRCERGALPTEPQALTTLSITREGYGVKPQDGRFEQWRPIVGYGTAILRRRAFGGNPGFLPKGNRGILLRGGIYVYGVMRIWKT